MNHEPGPQRPAEVPAGPPIVSREIAAGSRAGVPWGLDLAASWSWRLLVIGAATYVLMRVLAFLIHVAVPDNDHLYAFVIDRLTERAEVADVRTSIVYEHLRAPSVSPRPTIRGR